MTIIQSTFINSQTPDPREHSQPLITALKMLSYSDSANPGKAWKELVFVIVLFARLFNAGNPRIRSFTNNLFCRTDFVIFKT